MKWISIKEELPAHGEKVLILLDTVNRQVLIANFIKELDSAFGRQYKNTWFICPPPRIPKHWVFTEEYNKAYQLPKGKVTHWSYIPELPSRS